MKGTELVLKALVDNGVKFIFGYTGGAIMPVFDEMENQEALSFIMSRHEQGAVFMAQGISRASLSTSDPRTGVWSNEFLFLCFGFRGLLGLLGLFGLFGRLLFLSLLNLHVSFGNDVHRIRAYNRKRPFNPIFSSHPDHAIIRFQTTRKGGVDDGKEFKSSRTGSKAALLG